MRSYSPITSLSRTPFARSRMAVYTCVFVFPRVCATVANQARQRRGREGETGSIGEGAHTSVLGEGGGGRVEEEQTDKKKKKQGDKRRGRGFARQVPGRQPSAQIGPMGTHSLYTCSNQLAATTCLSGSFTLRHTPVFAEEGGSLQRRSSAAH